MKTFKIERMRPLSSPDDPSIMFEGRMMVKGARNFVGYRVGFCRRGYSARQIDSGPLVPGPWAFTFGCAAILDNHGGSRAEMDGERANGLLIEATPGDVLTYDGESYRIEFHPQGREWIELKKQGK